MEIITHSERETEAAGAALAAKLPDGAVVAMYGELGSGKTAFVRTFTIVNEYEGARTLIHFDMYRLGSADELWGIGWDDYLDRGAVCAVEWSENVQGAFTGNEVTVRFEKLGADERRITIGGPVC